MSLFEKYLQQQYRPSTAKVYRQIYQKFTKNIKNYTPAEIMEYLEKLPPSVRAVHAYAIKSYLEFEGKADVASKVPVSRPPFAMKTPRWLPEPVIKYIADNAYGSLKQIVLRIKAIIAVGYDLALRISELSMLDRTVNPDRPYIDVKTGKAYIYRLKTKQYPWQELELSKWALAHLQKYIENRDDNDPALFVTYRVLTENPPGRMSQYAIDEAFRSYVNGLLGIDVSFKVLRHSKLTWMAVEGKDLITIAKFAGHTTPNPTLIYIHAASQYKNNPEVFLETLKGSVIYDEVKNLILKPA